MRALIRHALVAASLLAVTAPLAHAITIPPDFVMENAVTGVTWVQPIAMASLPDGRWLVAEKRGRVWAVKNGARHATPLWQGDQEVLNTRR